MTTIYTVNNKVLKNSANDKWLTKYVDPYNPLGLPPFTIRVKAPYEPHITGTTTTPVTGQSDVYDIYKNSSDWHEMLYSEYITEVLGANTSGVTNMNGLFSECRNLSSVALFDTSNVTDMGSMFGMFSFTNNVLKHLPLFNTSKATNVEYCFNCLFAVESGALALYQQMSTQTTPPANYADCFTNCGKNTVSGAAELAQIPSSWGGTGA